MPVMSDILRRSAWCATALAACIGLAASSAPTQPTGLNASWLARYLPEVGPGELVPGADAYGTIREDLPVAPMLRDSRVLAWAFLTSDLAGTVGYSGQAHPCTCRRQSRCPPGGCPAGRPIPSPLSWSAFRNRKSRP